MTTLTTTTRTPTMPTAMGINVAGFGRVVLASSLGHDTMTALTGTGWTRTPNPATVA